MSTLRNFIGDVDLVVRDLGRRRHLLGRRTRVPLRQTHGGRDGQTPHASRGTGVEARTSHRALHDRRRRPRRGGRRKRAHHRHSRLWGQHRHYPTAVVRPCDRSGPAVRLRLERSRRLTIGAPYAAHQAQTRVAVTRAAPGAPEVGRTGLGHRRVVGSGRQTTSTVVYTASRGFHPARVQIRARDLPASQAFMSKAELYAAICWRPPQYSHHGEHWARDRGSCRWSF